MTAPPRPRRIESIDLLRGIVMILMALDHTREYFGATAISPTDLTRTSAALFMARWITHICAPTFFFLTGTSAWLTLGRRTIPQLSRLLITRGVWLVVLELTIVRCFGYQFNVDYRVTMLVVLWALGWAMIVLGLLVHLPMTAITAFGAALIAAHNLFDPVRAASLGALAPLWTILHAPGIVVATPAYTVFAAYPLVPWIGVTAVGFSLGPLYAQGDERRRRTLLRLAVASIVGFVVLRWVNIYGDPSPWTRPSIRLRCCSC
jgi:uncharacterized membrane protein